MMPENIANKLKNNLPQYSWCVECKVWRHRHLNDADVEYQVSSVPGLDGSVCQIVEFYTMDDVEDWVNQTIETKGIKDAKSHNQ